jgi:hypothetical protein
LQRKRDKKADRDHQQLEEEISPTPRRVMSRMNIHLPAPPKITGSILHEVCSIAEAKRWIDWYRRQSQRLAVLTNDAAFVTQKWQT